jgi:hypothetical protein
VTAIVSDVSPIVAMGARNVVPSSVRVVDGPPHRVVIDDIAPVVERGVVGRRNPGTAHPDRRRARPHRAAAGRGGDEPRGGEQHDRESNCPELRTHHLSPFEPPNVNRFSGCFGLLFFIVYTGDGREPSTIIPAPSVFAWNPKK